jgi:WD40 repeat protein
VTAAGGDDSTVKVWDRRQRNPVHNFNSNFQVTAVVLSDDSQQVGHTRQSVLNLYLKQCSGSVSGSAWIRIKFASLIRIRIPNADPDPAADKMSSKSQNNSYHLELFD